MEMTEFSSNSPDSKIFFRCLLIAGVFTPKSSPIAFFGKPEGFVIKINRDMYVTGWCGVEEKILICSYNIGSIFGVICESGILFIWDMILI